MASANTNTNTGDKLDADLFLTAQERMWEIALHEIKTGYKRSHWVWYIWPQISGLGRSAMAQTYAIPSLEAATEYLNHEVLGARLREITQAALDWNARGRDIRVLMGGETDKMKLKSSMTLFLYASDPDENDNIFRRMLDKYYEGEADRATEDRLLELVGLGNSTTTTTATTT